MSMLELFMPWKGAYFGLVFYARLSRKDTLIYCSDGFPKALCTDDLIRSGT